MKFIFVKREPLSVVDGISQFIFSVSDALMRLGHEVVCITTSDSNLHTIPHNFDFQNYPKLEAIDEKGGAYSVLLAAQLWLKKGRAIVARHNPDILILNGALPVLFSQPVVLVAHDLEARKLFGDVGRIAFKALTYRFTNQLVVTCPELINPVASDSLCDEQRFIVIPTCIDTQRYHPLPLSERLPLILHCGFQPYKKPNITLEAFAAMKNQNATLVMVGKIDPAIKEQAKRLPLNVQERIHMPGVVTAEELKRLLTSARIMSVPSEYKIPVASPTVLEALASHTPIVLSSSISKIVANEGVNSFVENSPQNMAKRFDELISQNDLWSKISAGCAETKIEFDSVTIARQYEKLTNDLLRR